MITGPGLRAIIEPMAPSLEALGVGAGRVADLAEVDDETLAPIVSAALEQPGLYWSLAQRGPMVHGTDSVAGYLRALPPFTLADRVNAIECPVFLTAAEGDMLSATASSLHDELGGRSRFVAFTDAEAAGGH